MYTLMVLYFTQEHLQDHALVNEHHEVNFSWMNIKQQGEIRSVINIRQSCNLAQSHTFNPSRVLPHDY